MQKIKVVKNEEILELYVNYIYYGSGYYDIKSASLGYFDKEPQDLTEGESITLAGIPFVAVVLIESVVGIVKGVRKRA